MVIEPREVCTLFAMARSLLNAGLTNSIVK